MRIDDVHSSFFARPGIDYILEGDLLMAGNKKDLGIMFAEIFELPYQALPEVPLILIAGDGRLYLENHGGLLEYRDDYLKIRISRGKLILQGENFVIEDLKQKELLISGQLKSLQIKSWGDQ